MNAREYPLVETPDLLLAALERANDAVVIVDGDLRVSHFNAAAELIWGVDRADVLGCDASCLGLGDLRQHSIQMNGAGAFAERDSEITIVRRDGSRIRAALSLSRVEIGGESTTIAFARDITAEVDRKQRLALMTQVADRTNRAVVVADHDLNIVYTNAA